ncbi:DoxX family membrane protein [Streptomyces qinglanensis]|uniref:DoxX family membrane protein n=1 Tax=Streptomyces qinglanensis TaxID=943816 RepID=UPI003D71D4AC
MTPLQLVSRPLLGVFFVNAGVGTLSRPEPPAELAAPFLERLREKVPLPGDDVTLVRVNAAVQVVAGALLATGRVPRTAALALAGSLLPTTLAGHPFWEQDDPGQRAAHRIHFGKNTAIVGGLLAVVSDADHHARARALRARAKKHRAQHCPAHSRHAAAGRPSGTARVARCHSGSGRAARSG